MGDVGVIERGQKLRLASESRHSLRVMCECLWQNLQRDVALQPSVACAVDLSHSTRAQ